MAQLTKDEVLNQIEMTEAGATLAERLLADEELRAAIMKVDFLARFPFSLEETAARLRQALALPVADGVEVAAGEAHLLTLEDASEKLTLSAPLDEPDDRAHERRPMARIVASIDDPLLASKARVRAWLALGLLHGAHF